MYMLFVDDSYASKNNFLAYGGFCVNASQVQDLSRDITLIKERHKIPASVELKWSPDPKHYFRTGQFKGNRQVVFTEVFGALTQYFCLKLTIAALL